MGRDERIQTWVERVGGVAFPLMAVLAVGALVVHDGGWPGTAALAIGAAAAIAGAVDAVGSLRGLHGDRTVTPQSLVPLVRTTCAAGPAVTITWVSTGAGPERILFVSLGVATSAIGLVAVAAGHLRDRRTGGPA